jgi:hypothetical protein
MCKFNLTRHENSHSDYNYLVVYLINSFSCPKNFILLDADVVSWLLVGQIHIFLSTFLKWIFRITLILIHYKFLAS